jgi:hypothetical protein
MWVREREVGLGAVGVAVAVIARLGRLLPPVLGPGSRGLQALQLALRV